MATNGSKSVAVSSHNTLEFAWGVSSQSVDNNTSSVYWELRLHSDSYGAISSSASKSYTVKVNGTEYTGKNTVGIGNSSTKLLASGTTSITHNDDGTKTFDYSFSQTFSITFSGSTIGTVSGSGSGTLNTIARASSVSCTTANIGSKPTITITRASSSFTHTLTYTFGTKSGTIATKTSSTSITTWTLPDSLYEAIPNAKSGTGTITCKTFNGNTEVGSKTCSFTANAVEADCKPTLSSTAIDIGSVSKTLTDNTGTMIKGYNVMRCTVNATANKYSTITSQYITNGGKRFNASSHDYGYTEDNVFIFSATDSRGYTTTKTITVPMVDYTYVTANLDANIELVTENTSKATITIGGKYKAANFGAVQNTLTVKYRTNSTGASDFGDDDWQNVTATISGDTYTATIEIQDIPYTDTLYVQGYAADAIETIETNVIALKTVPVFDWDGNDFAFNVPVSIQGNAVADYIVERGTASMGGTAGAEWQWEKWASGKAVCYGVRNYGNMAVTKKWDILYESEGFSQDFPTGLFIEAPVHLDIHTLYSGACLSCGYGYNHENGEDAITKDNTGIFFFYRPNGSSLVVQQVYVQFYAIGKWR